MAGIRLKVTPEQLKIKSEEVTRNIKSMEQAFEEMTRLVQKTSGYWIGLAGDAHRKLYDEDKKVVEEMLKRLKEHPSDLLIMAGVYTEAETAAKNIIESLPIDIIE